MRPQNYNVILESMIWSNCSTSIPLHRPRPIFLPLIRLYEIAFNGTSLLRLNAKIIPFKRRILKIKLKNHYVETQ